MPSGCKRCSRKCSWRDWDKAGTDPDPVRLTRCSPAQCERSRCEWEEAMLKQHIAACLVGTVLATAPALAQTSPAPTSSPASKAPSGMSGQFITQQTPGQWRASKLVGVDAHGTDNAKIGDVREVLVNRDGATEAVVIGVGGFLGLGEKDVAVPFQALEWVTEPRTTATSTAAPGAAPEAAPETLAPPP